MCPLTEGVPETKAGCSVWLVYKFGQRVLVKRLYVSAKLIKQTNCCEKLSDLPSFPRAGALLRSSAPCKLHISNRFRWDRSIRITPNSTSFVSVAPTLVSTGGSQVAALGHQDSSSQTGSLLWSTTLCTPLPTFLLSPTQVFLRPGWGG